jgi:hypothetical protein
MAPRLTDRQQSAVLSAVNPLERQQRAAFLSALSLLLNDRSEIEDGELFRLLHDFPQMTVESRR